MNFWQSGFVSFISNLNSQVLCAEKRIAKEQVTTALMTAACYQMEVAMISC